MRLAKLYLSPLGAFSKKQLDFTPGLNVVLGPNEAGKSTVFAAVRLVLLVSTDLTKKERDRLIRPLLPVSGGDFVRVAVEFHRAGEVFRLVRKWGTDPSSKLDLPGGGSIGDEEKVQEKLAELLPARPGTMEHILMTGQGVLSRTLESLQKEAQESVADFSDILRRAVLETGGVSVDRFLEKVKNERDFAFQKWDRQAGAPERSKGRDKPHTRGLGTVLAAWNTLEKARDDRRKAAAWEADTDAVNAGLRQAAAKRAAQETFLRTHETAAKDARERRALEAERQAAGAQARALEQTAKKWPVAEERAQQLQQSLSKVESARAALEEERRAALKADEDRALRDRHAKVLRRKAAVDEAQARLAALPRMEKKALAEIRAAAAALSRLEAEVQGGRISVTVAGRTAGELLTQEDFSPEKKQGIGPERTLSLSAAGRIRIVHKELEIEVRSGDTDAQARAEKTAAARRALAELLKRHGAASPEAAEESGRVWEDCAADLRGAEKSLAEELGGEKLAELSARVAALGEAAPARSVQDVAADLAGSKAQAEAQTKELEGLQRQIGEWQSAHPSLEELYKSLAGARGRETELESRIKRAGSLPEGFTDVEAFVQAFEQAREDVLRLGGEQQVLEGNKRALEKLPEEWGDQSAEELGVQVADAEEAFDAELRRAQALDRLAEKSAALLSSTDSTISSGLTSRLSEMLSAMTAGRHSGLVMEGPLPVGLAEGDGVSLDWDQLSAGTRDTLGLALRLAMADYFLGQEDGFLLLDDPLVEMDPERQKAAAAALKAFAARRQLIVFTCHPAAATLLGGTLIRLAGPASPPRQDSAPDPLARPGSSRAAR